MKIGLAWAPMTLALILMADSASALPRFALRTGAKCQSCHVNPSGGAMRQPFGMQYGRDRLPVEGLSTDMEVEDLTNIISSIVGVGADFRTLYYYVQDTSAVSSNRNSFWQMQGNFYLNFRVSKKVNLFFNKGLYSGFEAFGLFTILPSRGHIKVGKFLPNFGLRFDDHTAYVRTYTGFSPQQDRPELTGGEVGIAPGMFSVVGGIYNSVDGYGGSTLNTKALLGRAEVLFPVVKDLYVNLGGNVFTRGVDASTTKTVYGGFGGLGYGPLAVFGELDWIKTRSDAGTLAGLTSYVEADYLLVQGIDLKLAYDFYDPDLDVKTGSRSRYSMGVEFFPLAGVEVRLLYRFVREEADEIKNDELDLLLHLYL